MIGAYPQTPAKRAFDEYAEGEMVESSRNGFSTAVFEAAAVVSTVVSLAVSTVLELAKRSQPVMVKCVHLANSAKRRILELLPARIAPSAASPRSNITPSTPVVHAPSTPIVYTPLTPQSKATAMETRSVSRLEEKDRPTEKPIHRSFRGAYHQDFPAIVRPVLPSPSPPLYLHRIKGLCDYTISKSSSRFPSHHRIGGWRPKSNRAPRPPRAPPLFRTLSPNAKQAFARKHPNNTTIWNGPRTEKSATCHRLDGVQRTFSKNTSLNATTSLPSTNGSAHLGKPISKAIVHDDTAHFNASPYLASVSARLATKSHTTLITEANFPSDDESDHPYTPSGSSSDETSPSEYEDLTSDENLTAIEQGSPSSPISHLAYTSSTDSTSSRQSSPELDRPSALHEQTRTQENHKQRLSQIFGNHSETPPYYYYPSRRIDPSSTRDEQAHFRDGQDNATPLQHTSLVVATSNVQDELADGQGDYGHPQSDYTTHEGVVVESRERNEYTGQAGSTGPGLEKWLPLYDTILSDSDNASVGSNDGVEAQRQRELNSPSPEDIEASLEAQWQRELQPIPSIHSTSPPNAPTTDAASVIPIPLRPINILPSPTAPTLEIPPTIPVSITPPHADAFVAPTSADAHESAKSKRRYELRIRTTKSYQAKEADRIRAEEKLKEQKRVEKEKKLAKKRAKAEEAAARRAREEAENAEWILRGSRDKTLTNLVQPVNKEWEAKVRAEMARRNPTTQLTISVTGTTLTRHAFGTLLPGPGDSQSAWLNDEMVAAYLDLVCAHGNEKYGITQEAIKNKTAKPKYAVLATQFMTALRGPRGYSAVSRWAGRKQIAGASMLNCEYVFVPIHVNGNHWTILIVSPARRTVEYFDSFGSDGSVYTDAMMDYLRNELKEGFVESEWRVWSSAESAVQRNARDCGVFSVTTAKAVTLGFTPKIAFAQEDMSVQRMRMAAELLNGGFIL